MNLKIMTFCIVMTFLTTYHYGQSKDRLWKTKKCAVVLTYDDALNIHLDKVIPALDSHKFKGTFYLISSAPVVSERIEEWRKAAKKGHELGNHTLNHPCDGSLPGRSFVTVENDLSKYTIARAVNEIKTSNTLLQAIDGKKERTFAYPCGDLKIHDTLFYPYLKNEFVAARGVQSGFLPLQKIDLTNVNAFSQVETSAEQMIAQVKEAEINGALLVFLFHGVGGEHSLNVNFQEHQKLLDYLKKREKDIWVAPMVDVSLYIKEQLHKFQ